jgi:hypothetical protein
METEKQIRILQTAYAGVIADAVTQLGKENVLESVTERKHLEQLTSGKMRAAQFGVTKPEEAFEKISELFGCAKWKIDSKNENSFIAETHSCLLCGIAKKTGAPSPCRLYCLSPMEGMVKGLAPQAKFNVEDTLWNGAACKVIIET